MKSLFSMIAGAFALTAILGGCGSETSDDDLKTETPSLIEINEVVPGTLFATFDPQKGYKQMETAAKTACGSETICEVIIFPPGTVLPTQFPMTDREVSQQIGNYTMNRNTGADELLVSCDSVDGAPENACAAN